MQSWIQWIKESFRLTVALVRQQWVPLFGLSAVTGLFELWAEDAMQLAADSAEKVQRWDLQVAVGLTDLISGIILFLLLCWAIPKVRELKAASFMPQPFTTPYIGSFLAEYLRMLAQTLLYGILLLLPGVYRYCQLSFVPLLALFSKDYRAGKVDALKFSEKLARPYLPRIFASLFVTFALGIGIQFLPEMVESLHTWPVRFFFALTGDLLSIWAFALVYLLFESAMAEAQEVAHD